MTTIYPLGRPAPIGDTTAPDLISAVQLALAAIGTCNEACRTAAAENLATATGAVLALLVGGGRR